MGAALIDIKTTETIHLDSFPGVEVEVQTAVSMRDFMVMGNLADIGAAGGEGVDEAIVLFGDKFLIDWNISGSDENGKRPRTGESLAGMPMAFQFELLTKWMALMKGPSAPLGQESSDGLDSPTKPSTDSQ